MPMFGRLTFASFSVTSSSCTNLFPSLSLPLYFETGPGGDAEYIPQSVFNDRFSSYFTNSIFSNTLVRGQYGSGRFCPLWVYQHPQVSKSFR